MEVLAWQELALMLTALCGSDCTHPIKLFTIHSENKAPPFHIIRRTLLSSKTLAFCLLAISSNFGWRHVPGDGVETAAWAA